MKRTKKGELHLHTTHSDGWITADDIKRCALDFIAVTDHDTVDGFKELKARLNGSIELIPGIELSTRYAGKSIHVLAYFFDYNNPELLRELEYYRKKRVERARKNFELLRGLGYAVDESRLNRNGTLAKPTIAMSVLELPENNELLVRNMIDDVDDFIDAYLVKGKPAYVGVEKISLDRIRELCKGPLVLAHPGVDLKRGKDDWIIKDLKEKYNFKGVEAFTRRHNGEERDYYHKLAKNLDLVPTFGSDAHHYHRIGLYAADYELVEKLRA